MKLHAICPYWLNIIFKGVEKSLDCFLLPDDPLKSSSGTWSCQRHIALCPLHTKSELLSNNWHKGTSLDTSSNHKVDAKSVLKIVKSIKKLSSQTDKKNIGKNLELLGKPPFIQDYYHKKHKTWSNIIVSLLLCISLELFYGYGSK